MPHSVLSYTKEANHRVFVGVSWDPNDDVSFVQEVAAKVQGKSLNHNLDLSCMFFDEHHNVIGSVTADPSQLASEGGKIYHSGDDQEGFGDGDDEQISVELNDIDERIAHVVFYVDIKSEQTFNQIKAPEIHLSDGYSGRPILHVDIRELPAHQKSAFIFVRIYKKEGEWMLHNISEFCDLQDEWTDALKPYLAAE